MILSQFNLEGKVAIVTGSSTGLGQGMAFGLAEAGADIAGVYHPSDPPENQDWVKAARQLENLCRDGDGSNRTFGELT